MCIHYLITSKHLNFIIQDNYLLLNVKTQIAQERAHSIANSRIIIIKSMFLSWNTSQVLESKNKNINF